MRKVLCMIGAVLVFAGASWSQILIDDNFDDGDLKVNTNGVGTGWVPVGFGPVGSYNQIPTETGGCFSAVEHVEQGRCSGYGKDNFNFWNAEGVTITWEIKSFNMVTAHRYGLYLAYVMEMGIVSANNTSKTAGDWLMWGANHKGGLYVGIAKKDNGNTAQMYIVASNKNVTDANLRWLAPHDGAVRAPNVFINTFPIIVTMTVSNSRWSITTNQSGLASFSGNWTTDLVSGAQNATITDEFNNGAWLYTGAANHGIDDDAAPFGYPANTCLVERVKVIRNSADTNQVATPSISPSGTSFEDSVQVTLSAASGSTIRYTTTGSDPTSTSTQYAAPFWIKNTAVVKARAFKSGLSDSPVASATFTKTVSGQAPYSGTPFPVPCKIESEDYDLGGEGVAYHDLTTNNQGGKYRTDDVDVESKTGVPGTTVGYVSVGEWLEYTVNVPTAGNYDIDLRVANNGNNGQMHIEFGGVNKTGVITVPNTGGWDTYQTTTKTNVALSAGQQIMRVSFDAVSSDGGVANIDWVEIKNPATVIDRGSLVNRSGAFINVGPNPMRNQITFALPQQPGLNTQVQVFNRTGSLVHAGMPQAGLHSYVWDGKDSMGKQVVPGVYFYTVTMNGRQETGRIVVLAQE